MIREAVARGHENFLISGIPSGEEPAPDTVGTRQRAYVHFGEGELSFPVPGMSDVMPYVSTRFSDMSDAMLDSYERAFARVLDEVIADFKPDIIHAHHLWIVSALARRRFTSVPILAQCHGSDLRQHALCPVISAKIKGSLAQLDGVLALSHSQKADIEGLLDIDPGRIRVVGAGYRDSLFGPLRGSPRPAPPPVQIAYAGKLARAKGLPMLLDALARIDGGWHLQLFGATGGDEGLEILARARRFGSAITVHGAVSQETLAERLAACHVFVLPSFFEGLPLVVLEALASGCRLVVTDLPGIRELLDGLPPAIVRRVKLPRLAQVDRPLADDLPAFEADLVEAIEAQMSAARREPIVDPAPLTERLEVYVWSSVFRRVEDVYDALIV
jgi:alpha-maltose-1-phosphate synthase